ncbi:MAG: hypothetical protein MJ071_07170 [Oscillospiraceae bacterium]|nr:hypothetical protein [Oscillospiraceae bacterium]
MEYAYAFIMGMIFLGLLVYSALLCKGETTLIPRQYAVKKTDMVLHAKKLGVLIRQISVAFLLSAVLGALFPHMLWIAVIVLVVTAITLLVRGLKTFE